MKIRLLLVALISFLSFAVYSQSIGIIGDSTPGGWDADTDMTQDAGNPDLYTIDITLIDGAAKFRQDDDWAINWGATDFPAGVGAQGGDNIPVYAGDYTVTFNIVTGDYLFSVASDIGIIGDATPGGWDADTDMYIDQTDTNKYFTVLDLTMGEAKFRQDNDWAVNWGSTDFPIGTGAIDGDNIPIPQAGTYMITFDKSTGDYEFGEVITFASIGIIGDATPGGWDDDTDMTQSATDPNVWEGSFSLIDGGAKFRANDEWVIEWGGDDFPSGIGTGGAGNIPVVAGDYKVSLNTETGAYNFLEIVEYATIGIIGDATPGGWDDDTDMEKSVDDGAMWELRAILTDGELKFRADNDWAVNWGAGDFPTGVAVQEGANVPIPAGEYIISFNSITGDYHFEAIVVYNSVGIIGTGSPTMGWDDDTDMVKNIDDEFMFNLTADLFDGEVKFRVDDLWDVNWGDATWPTGFGTQDGSNIPSVAGTYAITFITDTGEFTFGDPSSNKDYLDPRSITIQPNPSSGLVQFEMEDERLQGIVSIRIYDMTGNLVLNRQMDTRSTSMMDLSDLANGNYSVHIQNGKTLVGKKLVIVK